MRGVDGGGATALARARRVYRGTVPKLRIASGGRPGIRACARRGGGLERMLHYDRNALGLGAAKWNDFFRRGLGERGGGWGRAGEPRPPLAMPRQTGLHLLAPVVVVA